MRKRYKRTCNPIKLLFILLLLAVSVFARGQHDNENIRVTFSAKNTPLLTVLKSIEKQTGYRFNYSNQVDITQKITIRQEKIPLTNALSALLSPINYSWKLINKNIFIISENINNKPTNTLRVDPIADTIFTLTGKVTDTDGKPIPGATISIKGNTKGTTSNADGNFSLSDFRKGSVIQITSIGFETREISVNESTLLIRLNLLISRLEEIDVVSTGYQNIPKERSAGSFVVIDNKLINRRVGTNVLDRLDGVASGVLFVGPKSSSALVQGSTGINVRGESTLSADVSRDPLIILDNFPYEGSIENINPNDIDKITILKDAAAASIWGARSGNGVIVITTKKGKFNSKPEFDFNTNLTIGKKPDVYYDTKFLNSSDYIDIERHLYENGFYNDDLNNTFNYPALSPVIEILNSTRSDAEKERHINQLRNIDVRRDFEKYIYQKSKNQQYSLSMRGGSSDLSYTISAGYDRNDENLIRNSFERFTINSQNAYKPSKNIEITTGLIYSSSKTKQNNQLGLGNIYVNGGSYGQLYPYAELIDANGNPTPIAHEYRQRYIDSVEALGFLDWRYRPIDEINNSDNSFRTTDLLAKVSLKYHITSYLNIEGVYQNETQKTQTRNYYNENSYTTRNYINGFTQYDAVTNTFTYPFPKGAILNIGNYNRVSNNARLQVNYNHTYKNKHSISGILGSEIREIKGENYNRTSYGYDDEYGTAANAIDYSQFFPINPGQFGRIPSPPTLINGTTTRFISYYSNIGYTFDDRLTVTISGRKDGANIFGVKTNDKITPLWSTGLAWNISRERFYRSGLLPYLKLRLSYGFNGNVYNGSAYVTGRFATSALTNLQLITDLLAPNPQLRWEKVRNINLGLDFASRDNRINGSLEVYRKDGIDLINNIPLAPSTGFANFNGNSARTKTLGTDLQINSINTRGLVNWRTYLLFSTIKDKVIEYNVNQNNASIQTATGVAIVGKPLYSLFSYRWAGLDGTNGDPLGYLNGKKSNDYSAIIDNYSPDSLVYNGSARPTIFGSVRNEVSFRNLTLSINVVFKGGYYFRRPSTNLGYTDILFGTGHSDASKRWQHPGDESSTNVPSFVYPSDPNRSKFYQYSEALIERADHIRLQDIRLTYDMSNLSFIRKTGFRNLRIYSYANNIGILWRRNNFKLDPDLQASNNTYVFPTPFTIAFGINLIF